MKEETQIRLIKIRTFIFKLFWWSIILVYSYAYVFYMPKFFFGVHQFTNLLWAVNFFAGLYMLMKTGGLTK